MNAHCSSLVLTHCEWVAFSLTLEHFVSIHAMPDRVTAHRSNGWSETAARLPESVCVIKNANSIGRILLNFKHTFSEVLSLSIYLGVCWLCRTSIDHISIDWLKFSRMPNKWRITAGNNNIINSNATITANSWNRQRNSSERMWKRRRWKKKKMRRHDYAWMLAGTEHVSTKFYHKIYFNLICVSAYDCMLWQWTNSLG